VLAEHSKSLNLLDSISVGVDRMQRNFGPMQNQVEAWRETELSNVAAKMIVYEAFIESELDVPKHLARRVHEFYFNPQYDQFKARTLWSLSNAFTSAFKEWEPIPQFKATAKLSVSWSNGTRGSSEAPVDTTASESEIHGNAVFAAAVLEGIEGTLEELIGRVDPSDVRDRLTALQDETAAVRRSLEKKGAIRRAHQSGSLLLCR